MSTFLALLPEETTRYRILWVFLYFAFFIHDALHVYPYNCYGNVLSCIKTDVLLWFGLCCAQVMQSMRAVRFLTASASNYTQQARFCAGYFAHRSMWKFSSFDAVHSQPFAIDRPYCTSHMRSVQTPCKIELANLFVSATKRVTFLGKYHGTFPQY